MLVEVRGYRRSHSSCHMIISSSKRIGSVLGHTGKNLDVLDKEEIIREGLTGITDRLVKGIVKMSRNTEGNNERGCHN